MRFTLGDARSLLFVPGDRPDRYDKATTSGADAVIVDLEDAVATASKPQARREVAAWLGSGRETVVRVNAIGSPYHDDDCTAVRGAAGLQAVMVPKAEDAEALSRLASGLGAPVIALVETAVGVLRAPELAAAGGVERLAFGHLDFILDIDATDDASALLLARSTLVLASRAARIYGPIDGVTARLDDVSATLADARVSRKLGFTGKLCLHPRQVSAVHQAYLPSGEEVGWASAIVAEATSGAAARVGGQLVDEPILRRAYRIRERAGLGDGH